MLINVNKDMIKTGEILYYLVPKAYKMTVNEVFPIFSLFYPL